MRLLEIVSHQWQILAPLDGTNAQGEDLCPVLDFLVGQEGTQYESSAAGLLAMIEKCASAENGPRIFNDDQCHEADKQESIYEFIKGDLRLLWFYGKDRKVIVCAQVFLKKSRKTPDAEKSRAIAMKNQYMNAHKQNRIEVIRDDS